MRAFHRSALFFVALAFGIQARAGDATAWTLELLPIGDAYNFDSRTKIRHAQLGQLTLDGEYDTRGLETPLHYAWRVARWQGTRAWELQLLHHKLYLENRPPGVESLSISHGFNIVTVNRVLAFDGWQARVGIGPVIAHPEAGILGSGYNGPYELAGAAVFVGVGKTIDISEHWYVRGDVAATYGYAEVNPEGEPRLEFSVRNPALHAQIGVGWRF